MRILIVSDTHKHNENLLDVLDKEKGLDMVIHCGDAEGLEDSIRAKIRCPLYIVAGNNDFFSDLSNELVFNIGSKRVLLTHGHYYYVNAGIAEIEKEASARRYDIVMFGHTHRPLIDYSKDIIALNPGSISYPRQEGRRPSYIVMDIDRKSEAHFEIRYL